METSGNYNKQSLRLFVMKKVLIGEERASGILGGEFFVTYLQKSLYFNIIMRHSLCNFISEILLLFGRHICCFRMKLSTKRQLKRLGWRAYIVTCFFI